MIIQWGVVIGVWACLLVDVLGNYAAQGGDDWLYIIGGTACVLTFVVAAAVRALFTELVPRHREPLRSPQLVGNNEELSQLILGLG